MSYCDVLYFVMLYFVVSYHNMLCDITKPEFLMQPVDTKMAMMQMGRRCRSWCSDKELSVSSPDALPGTWKACRIHWFSLCFKHINKLQAISKHRPLTGQGLEALSDHSPKKIDVFLAWFYWCFRDYEQRRRRRTAHFARATAPQTYHMFRKND